jgi:hypothetical protein
MSDPRPSGLARLRALCAALALLIAALSPGIALATQTADTCGMVCCINQGRCCCNPHHASVKGQISDNKPRISEARVSASCPEGCATGVRSSNVLLREHLRTGPQKVIIAEPAAISRNQVVVIRDPVDSGPSAPRAPPYSSTI